MLLVQGGVPRAVVIALRAPEAGIGGNAPGTPRLKRRPTDEPPSPPNGVPLGCSRIFVVPNRTVRQPSSCFLPYGQGACEPYKQTDKPFDANWVRADSLADQRHDEARDVG